MRTIQAPGVEIKEIDKSQYAKTETGTKCFVMGFAQKGEPYFPMEFSSRNSWINYYGEPTNEAERYFFNACMEVINQNGILYCSRIPYDNNAYGKMMAYKFKVGQNCKPLPNAGQYLKGEVGRAVDHDEDYETDALNYVFGHKFYREIDGKDETVFEFDNEIMMFYKEALKAFHAHGRQWEIQAVKDFEPAIKAAFGGLDRESEYTGVTTIQDIKDLIDRLEASDDSTLNELAKRLKAILDKISNVRYSVQYYTCDLSNSTDLWKRSHLLKDVEEYVKSFDELGVNGLVKYTSQISCDNGDWIGQVLKYDYKHDVTLSGKEIILSSKAEEYWAELSAKTVEISGYKHHDSDVSVNFIFPVNINGEVLSDGYNDEYIYNNTMSTIYEELALSNWPYYDENYQKIRSLSELWADIWKAAKSKSLSALAKQDADASKLDNYLTSFQMVRDTFRDQGGITFKDVYEKYGVTQERIANDVPYYALPDADASIDNYLQIEPSLYPVEMDQSSVDAYRTEEEKVPAQTFWVVDKTCGRFGKIIEDNRKGHARELIGIFPVITTAANALYAQSMIGVQKEESYLYETALSAVNIEGNALLPGDLVTQFANKKDTDELMDTICRDANNYFASIQMNPTGTGFDTENMKKIGVVVYKAYLDASEGNKVSVTPVEAFCGELDKNAKNPNTGASTFIDKIVNTQSDYIYFFSNCFVNKTTQKNLEKADLFIAKPGQTGMLGFFESDTATTISLPKLLQGMEKCFTNVQDINERDIDIIPDAGLGNIAQYMKSIWGGGEVPQEYDLQAVDDMGNPLIKYWKCQSNADVTAWKTVEQKLDNFCKNVRKDCMFIADGLRPIVIQGDKKIVRPSKPTNSIDEHILPYVKWVTGLNTNYGAGYLDWFQAMDDFTGQEFWCPPSIKAMGVYINTDVNYNYWDAPAGLNRGVVAALDCAFSPTIKQAGTIYEKNWNYAINYPNDGIVLEGQKTFQVKPSAFDRVNVRRLFLRLERQTYKVARYFVYEGNTQYTRQRLVDTLTPIFNYVKANGGIYDYKIICDESINTPEVIDNNELKVKIGIKPVKSAEFILIDFIALSTGGSFSEM